MEFTIKKIISIDKNAQKFKEKLDLRQEREKKELNLLIKNMNEETLTKIENKKKVLMEKKVEEANIKAQSIIDEGKEQINELLKSFYKEQQNISEEVFKKIIISCEDN